MRWLTATTLPSGIPFRRVRLPNRTPTTMVRYVLALLSALAIASASAISVSIGIYEYPRCIYNTGALAANASGGVGPYTYLWSNGATASYISDLAPGTYSVTVTDFNGDQATNWTELESVPLYGGGPFWLPGCPDAGFPGGPGKRLFLNGGLASVGLGPFTSSLGMETYLLEIPSGAFLYMGANASEMGSPLDFTITDVNGCVTDASTIIPPDPEWLAPQVLDVQGACSGGNNGSILIHVPAEPNGWESGMRLMRDGVEYGWTSMSNGSSFGGAANTVTRTGLSAGIYQVIQTIDWGPGILQELQDMYFPTVGESCADTLLVEVPDLGYTCGTVMGRVFVDANENCQPGGGDANLPNTVVEIQPGDHFAITDGGGQYAINVPYGTYTIADQNALFQEHCGVEGAPFTVSSGQANVTRNLADTSLVGLDVRVQMGSGAARPGFEILYGIDVDNLTGVLSGAGTLTFTYDPTLIYLNAGTPPTSVTGNVITWNFSSLNAFADRDFYARFQVPPDINLLGQELSSSAVVSVAGAETDLTNNTTTHTVTVTGSYDPNDKSVRTASGVEGVYLINGDDRLEYTIRFQNTGTDTAFFVVITDTLQPTLDPATFQLGAASHPMSMLMRDHVLKFMFANILLPDSNASEPQSHGFVTYSIKPYQPVLPGTVIENIANIFFDHNPPVITEPSVLVAEFSTEVQEQTQVPGQLRLLPNPAKDQLQVKGEGTMNMIRIIAADGREVMHVPVRSMNASLDVERLNAGVYLLIATLADGSQAYERFIKE